MKNENFPADPNLEPRIVAWVLGEASPFEVAELERHLIEHPELAVFKRRIEAVHGLVGEAVRPAAPLPKLSDERRAKLLATFGAEPATGSASVMALKPYRARPWWQVPPAWMAAAACLMTGLVLLWLAVPRHGSFALHEKSDRFEAMAQKRATAVDMPMLMTEEPNPVAASTSVQPGERHAAPLSLAAPKEFVAPPAIAQGDVVGSDASGNPIIRLPAFAVVGERQGFSAAAMAGSRSAPLPKPDLAMPKPTLPDFSEINGKTKSFSYTGSATASRVATISAQSKPVGWSAPEMGSKRVRGTGRVDLSIATTTVGGNLPNNLAITSTNGAIALDGNSNVTTTGASSIAFAPGNTDRLMEPTDLSAVASATPARPDPSATLLGPAPAGGGIELSGGASARDDVVALDQFSVSSSRDSKKAEVTSVDEKDANVLQKSAVEGATGNEPIQLFAFEVAPKQTPAAKRRAAPVVAQSAKRDVSIVQTDDLVARDSAATTAAPAPTATVAPQSTAAETDKPIVHPEQPTDESLRTEVQTQAQSISTFSLHVSDVSFRLAQAALDKGELPDRGAIRPEEFYNAFDYGDPAPVAGEPVACHVEQAAHPFLQQRNLVRIAMKIPATGRGAGQPLRLTVLLDTSGSMEREDRVATVRQAFGVLASLVGADDQITLIGFARQPRLLAERVRGTDAKKLVDIVAHTPAEGGTNLEEALKLAGEQARAQFQPGAQNRIVVLTDGAANLGNDDPNRLAAQVAALRQQGISFDACGVGIVGLDDSVLEALTRKGDGRYYVINSPEEADAGFAHQLAGALRPAAENVKVQVRFNPARVQAYRLIGFEQHRLKTEDFRNDQVTAAELAADEGAVALYQVQVKADGDGELGDVFVRFRNAATGEMVERSWTLRYEAQPAAFDRASASMQLAGVSALLAEKLRGGAAAESILLADLAPTVNRLRAFYSHDSRVQQLVTMYGQMRRRLNE